MHVARRRRGAVAFAAVAVIAAIATGPARAQGDRLARLVDGAVTDLADPAKTADAVRRLENLGAAAIGPLRARLRPSAGTRVPADVCVPLTYVLGRLGRHAVPALPELRAQLRDDRPPVVQQALWSLSMVAPFLAVEQCELVLEDLGTPRTVAVASPWWRARHSLLRLVLEQSLALGEAAEARHLQQFLGGWNAQQTAACRWLRARPDAHPAHRDAFAAQLATLLDDALARAPIRWLGPLPGATTAPEAAEAWLALTGQPVDARAARALLDHDVADARRRATAWLHDGGRTLPLRQRADLVGRLWDVDAAIVQAAAAAFAAWGADGLVALPALRLMQRTAAPERAAACERAADAIVAAASAWAEPDRAWLAAIDAALRGTPAPATAPPAPRCTAVALAATTDVLLLAQWCDAVTLARVLELCPQDVPDDTVLAVFGWLAADDAAVAEAACAWLARRGAAARGALATVGDADTMLGLAATAAIGRARPAAAEMAAHVALAGADGAALAQAIDAANGRMVTHALALALAQSTLPPAVAAIAPRLRELLAARARMSVEARHGDVRFPIPADLTDQLRSLCAIALCELGEPFEPPRGLAHALRSATGLELEGLAARVAELRRSGELVAVLERVEQGCRTAMDVPASVRWPPLRPSAPR